MQAQIEDRAGLNFGQAIRAVLVDRVRWIVDQLDILRDVMGGPVLAHQLFARFARIGGATDQRDDFVDIFDRDSQAAQDMRALAGLVQIERGAACDDFFAEGNEAAEDALQVHLLGTAIVQRQHVRAESWSASA